MMKVELIVILSAAVASASGSCVRLVGMTDRDPVRPAVAKGIVLIAHQGLHGKFVPGNTVEAIAAAYSNGWKFLGNSWGRTPPSATLFPLFEGVSPVVDGFSGRLMNCLARVKRGGL